MLQTCWSIVRLYCVDLTKFEKDFKIFLKLDLKNSEKEKRKGGNLGLPSFLHFGPLHQASLLLFSLPMWAAHAPSLLASPVRPGVAQPLYSNTLLSSLWPTCGTRFLSPIDRWDPPVGAIFKIPMDSGALTPSSLVAARWISWGRWSRPCAFKASTRGPWGPLLSHRWPSDRRRWQHCHVSRPLERGHDLFPLA